MSIFLTFFLSFFFQKVIQVKKPAAEEIENSSFELWDVGTLLFTRRLFKQACYRDSRAGRNSLFLIIRFNRS